MSDDIHSIVACVPHTEAAKIIAFHNAALAAAWRKGHSDAQAPALERIDELRKQLAAEREKVNVLEYAIGCLRVSEKTLVKALEEIANGNEASGDSLRRYAANEIARLNQ